jgi:excisionase family DNA binding protein
MKKLYNAKDVAELFGVSPSTIYAEADRCNLAGFRVGNSWRFSEEDILNYISAKEKEAKAGKAIKVPKVPAPDTPEKKPTPPAIWPVISTRHRGVVTWLQSKGIIGKVLDRVTYEDVRDKIVIGELPISLVFHVKAFYKVEFVYARRDDLYDSITPAEMDKLGARLSRVFCTRELLSLEEAKAQIESLKITP